MGGSTRRLSSRSTPTGSRHRRTSRPRRGSRLHPAGEATAFVLTPWFKPSEYNTVKPPPPPPKAPVPEAPPPPAPKPPEPPSRSEIPPDDLPPAPPPQPPSAPKWPVPLHSEFMGRVDTRPQTAPAFGLSGAVGSTAPKFSVDAQGPLGGACQIVLGLRHQPLDRGASRVSGAWTDRSRRSRWWSRSARSARRERSSAASGSPSPGSRRIRLPAVAGA